MAKKSALEKKLEQLPWYLALLGEIVATLLIFFGGVWVAGFVTGSVAQAMDVVLIVYMFVLSAIVIRRLIMVALNRLY